VILIQLGVTNDNHAFLVCFRTLSIVASTSQFGGMDEFLKVVLLQNCKSRWCYEKDTQLLNIKGVPSFFSISDVCLATRLPVDFC